MIYIVLGMHKSGTTLISQILHKSGINMGAFDEEVSYDKGNQYERKETFEINKKILNCGNAHSLDVITPVASLPCDSSSHAVEIRSINNKLSQNHRDWGFKDPRTCLTYPFWHRYLPRHCVIYVYRDPKELWHHYRRNIPKRKVISRLVLGYKSLRAWYIYNSLLIQYMKEFHQPYIIINFRNFVINDKGMETLRSFTGMPLHDCRQKELYRSKAKPDWLYDICMFLLDCNKKNSCKDILFTLQHKEYETIVNE